MYYFFAEALASGVEGIINGLHMFYVLRVGMSCLMSYFCVQDPVPQRASGRRRGGGPLQALLARHRARRMGKGEFKCTLTRLQGFPAKCRLGIVFFW